MEIKVNPSFRSTSCVLEQLVLLKTMQKYTPQSTALTIVMENFKQILCKTVCRRHDTLLLPDKVVESCEANKWDEIDLHALATLNQNFAFDSLTRMRFVHENLMRTNETMADIYVMLVTGLHIDPSQPFIFPRRLEECVKFFEMVDSDPFSSGGKKIEEEILLPRRPFVKFDIKSSVMYKDKQITLDLTDHSLLEVIFPLSRLRVHDIEIVCSDKHITRGVIMHKLRSHVMPVYRDLQQEIASLNTTMGTFSIADLMEKQDDVNDNQNNDVSSPVEVNFVLENFLSYCNMFEKLSAFNFNKA